MSKVALITGITGQDGSYLAELLLSKGYKVHGIVRRIALEDETHRLWRIRNILKDITLHAGSLESYARIFNIILPGGKRPVLNGMLVISAAEHRNIIKKITACQSFLLFLKQ